MSWLSKAAKKVEKTVSNAATKVGVGNDLKKAANIFGAANVGGAAGVVTGFMMGGATGAVYGGITGGITAGVGKYKGQSSSQYLGNSAINGAIAGTVGPLIYKPAASAIITAPGPVASYGTNTLVTTSNGSAIGSLFSSGANAIKDAVAYIGKGGLTAAAISGFQGLFTKGDPGTSPNPDYSEGNAVAPGGSFTQWLNSVLPGKSYDPTAPGSSPTGGGGSNPTNVEIGGSSLGGGGTDFSALSGPVKLIGIGLIGMAGYFLIKKKGFAHG